jgi:hypothetical protein
MKLFIMSVYGLNVQYKTMHNTPAHLPHNTYSFDYNHKENIMYLISLTYYWTILRRTGFIKRLNHIMTMIKSSFLQARNTFTFYSTVWLNYWNMGGYWVILLHPVSRIYIRNKESKYWSGKQRDNFIILRYKPRATCHYRHFHFPRLPRWHAPGRCC